MGGTDWGAISRVIVSPEVSVLPAKWAPTNLGPTACCIELKRIRCLTASPLSSLMYQRRSASSAASGAASGRC